MTCDPRFARLRAAAIRSQRWADLRDLAADLLGLASLVVLLVGLLSWG